MNSYFEKLTTTMKGTASNNNTASPHFLVPSPDHQNLTLPAALDRIDELRTRNCQLEIDLKCEHDEKADLVSIKVGLENEVSKYILCLFTSTTCRSRTDPLLHFVEQSSVKYISRDFG